MVFLYHTYCKYEVLTSEHSSCKDSNVNWILLSNIKGIYHRKNRTISHLVRF